MSFLLCGTSTKVPLAEQLQLSHSAFAEIIYSLLKFSAEVRHGGAEARHAFLCRAVPANPGR